MTVVCPICHGKGVAVKGNGVSPQREPEMTICWVCDGKGKVEEVPTEKIHIKKYYGIMAG